MHIKQDQSIIHTFCLHSSEQRTDIFVESSTVYSGFLLWGGHIYCCVGSASSVCYATSCHSPAWTFFHMLLAHHTVCICFHKLLAFSCSFFHSSHDFLFPHLLCDLFWYQHICYMIYKWYIHIFFILSLCDMIRFVIHPHFHYIISVWYDHICYVICIWCILSFHKFQFWIRILNKLFTFRIS